MNKEQEEQALRVLRDLDISEVMSLLLRGSNRYNKRILKFFRWFCKYVPIFIMIFHSYGVFMFSQHPREMFISISENMACYSFIYFMVYILPMVIIFASRFFWLCWKYRIPFFYFFGVNSIHIAPYDLGVFSGTVGNGALTIDLPDNIVTSILFGSKKSIQFTTDDFAELKKLITE